MLYFFLIFLIIDLYYLIPVVNAQIFNPTVELAIPTGTPPTKANAEIETKPLAETKTRNLKPYKPFYVFHSLNYCFFLLGNDLLFHLFF